MPYIIIQCHVGLYRYGRDECKVVDVELMKCRRTDGRAPAVLASAPESRDHSPPAMQSIH